MSNSDRSCQVENPQERTPEWRQNKKRGEKDPALLWKFRAPSKWWSSTPVDSISASASWWGIQLSCVSTFCISVCVFGCSKHSNLSNPSFSVFASANLFKSDFLRSKLSLYLFSTKCTRHINLPKGPDFDLPWVHISPSRVRHHYYDTSSIFAQCSTSKQYVHYIHSIPSTGSGVHWGTL